MELVFLRCLAESLHRRGLLALLKQAPWPQVLPEIAAETLARLDQAGPPEQQVGWLEETARLPPGQARTIASALAPRTVWPALLLPATARHSVPTAHPRPCAGLPASSWRTPETVAGPHGPACSSSSPVAALPVGRSRSGRSPHWALDELVGLTAWSEVWKVRHVQVDSIRPVVCKFCVDPDLGRRLLENEAGLVNQLLLEGRHPGIVPLVDVRLHLDPPCLEYELVEGGDLSCLLPGWQRLGGPERVQRVGRLIHRLASALGFAHRLEPALVHRDLKPSNVLLQRLPDNRVQPRLADFGLGGLAMSPASGGLSTADLTPHSSRGLPATSLLGTCTPLYASPQQRAGCPPDPRDDIYSVGVIWYQLLTGSLLEGAQRGWTGLTNWPSAASHGR